ncbi:amidohydrolase [Pseudoalteromonas phenolica]|uniref:Amidohydrolase n=1 Tax=Pseudoalteromonas phenolica TaxID=161398 RepID=A0A5S3YQM7_9GAMM|nr:amidohydrolase [Pseudoalteromonas phenolica]TMN86553.1 amidohydrolase [Pseudoalteromonas phenolica]TMP79068.1 amidohydrolase [Pseudoalteromonas phenolica]
MQKFAMSTVVLALAAALSGCQDKGPQKEFVSIEKNPYPSTYKPVSNKSVLITDATVLTGTGERLESADVYIVDGKIQQVGKDLAVQADTTVNAAGKWVTPGIIDVHSHLGAYPSPSVESHQDGNEMISPNTAEVWVEHSVWPQDPGFNRAREGGITTLQILPGSANLFGGRAVTLKNVPAHTMQAMKFPDAPYGLKMACGENPKRVYGRKGVAPYTRMGNMAGYRQAWIEATEYKAAWEQYEAAYKAGLNPTAPERDIKYDTLRGVLDGEILIHNHCYKAEEMAMMIDLSKEFGYHAGTFHHGIEAYKVADLLAENGNCAALWPDWWGFKMEAYDMVQENVAIVDAVKNSCAVVHSDSDTTIQRLNQEAAKIMYTANQNGFNLTEEHAIKWITYNAAKSLGVADKTGSLEAGKQADVVIWDKNPFSVYSKAQEVYVDGAKVYDRNDEKYQAVSDFMLGQR